MQPCMDAHLKAVALATIDRYCVLYGVTFVPSLC